ncbi:tetratricopeptide repeat protein [Bradyrhizobium sp.]|uniref:O-linked N-acetylglucosamine transferase, SPINDLY family protein n=1 Tax=Bradyrhizobium sp. TaxID=376 RepID=UPI003C41AFCB
MQSTIGSRAFQNARLQKKSRKQAEALLLTAVAAYRQGRHSEVQTLCRQILKDLPEHFDALRLLGVSELDCCHYEQAERFLALAVCVEPRSAETLSNLGLALFHQKRYGEARGVLERAVALDPNSPTALTNLGNALMRSAQPEEAVAAHDRAIRAKPDYGDAYCNRGMALLVLDRLQEAVQNFDRALSLQPRHLQAAVGKGMVSLNLRHFEAAHRAFDAALAIKPDMAEVLAHRGRLHLQLGQFSLAHADYDAALKLDPALETAWRGKAQLSLLTGNVAQSILACNKVLEQNPRSEIAITLLGACHFQQGDTATAIDLFDQALAIKPDYDDAIMKKIFGLDFMPDADFAVQQAVRREWWDRIGIKVPRVQLRHSSRDPDKRIVVGYVSSDFRGHSAALAFLPVLRHHDRSAFEVVCYSCSPIRDTMTDQARSVADIWVSDAWQLSDEELADRIQSDRVDILVDLSGHSAGNRLTIFARKPAPIQVSAWGNPTGTGLPTIDYVLADSVFIPESARHLFVERIYDLPCFLMMERPSGLQPSALPMLRNKHVTFGVFNRIDKISDGALALWSKLLQAIAGSRIVIKHGALDDPFLRDGLIGRFVTHGVAQESVTCIGATPRPDHLAAFANIDISLDPFPQNGGVSSWESLYAGVPVVTKLGNAPSARSAAAILNGIGLDDWVADDDDGYLAIAQKYASMPSHLEKLRAELPARIASSPAGNIEIYTRRVEAGYRQFWRDYCLSNPA